MIFFSKKNAFLFLLLITSTISLFTESEHDRASSFSCVITPLFVQRESLQFYGRKLSKTGFFGGYGGVDISLSFTTTAQLSAFIELGGGLKYSKTEAIEESYSFAKHGLRIFF